MSDEFTARLRAWTYRRQVLGDERARPIDVLGRTVAVYSSHPTAPIALSVRGNALDRDEFAELERSRQMIRLPAMRRSIFLMPTESAALAFAATREPIRRLEPNLRYAGLTWEAYASFKSTMREHLQEPATTKELQQIAAINGRAMTAIRIMAYEGLVLRLSGSLRGDSLCYVATEAWLGQPLESIDPAVALQWLAGRYLDGYGPARVRDFAWWAGVSMGRTKAAVATIDSVDVGEGYLLPASLQREFEGTKPLDSGALALLPKWDAYTMGYAPDGRHRLIEDRFRPQAYPRLGDGLPLVLLGGRAVALWGHTFKGDQMTATVTPFDPIELPLERIEQELARIGRMLGASTVEIQVLKPS